MEWLNTIRTMVVPLILAGIFLASCSNSQDRSLERIQQTGRIRLAMRAPYPPFSCFDAQGELNGFDTDIARALAGRLGVGLALAVQEWQGIVQGLMDGQYDGIVSSLAITPERRQVINFSEPYYHSAVQVIVRRGSPLQSLADLKGKIIALVEGSNYEGDARHLGAADIRFFNSGYRIIEALGEEQVDAALVDQVVGAYMILYDRLHVQLLGSPLRSEPVAIALRKEDLALLARINAILKEMQADGTLEKLIKKAAEGKYDCKGR